MKKKKKSGNKEGEPCHDVVTKLSAYDIWTAVNYLLKWAILTVPKF